MKKSLLKSTIREIKSSKARFLSIMAIIALGCGFYSGIKSTAPSMTEMANNYFERTNLMDYRLLSTVGFDEKDIKALGEVSDVTDVEGGYFSDVIASYNDGVHQVRLIAVNDKLNT
ncbi:MAG: ABC transporter permease, partial [Ruminococcus sp.]